MKRIKEIFLGVCAALAVSCSVDDDNGYYYYPDTAAHGIIANASPNSGDLYFYADANPVNQTGLNYTDANGYYNFYTGDRMLTLRNSAGAILASYELTLAAGNFFSAFAVNTFDNIELVVFEDPLVKPMSSNASVRFINLSPDADGIDIDDISGQLTSSLFFKQSSPFIELPAGSHQFDFTLTADGSPLYSQTVNLQPGRIYTIYSKGFVAPGTGSNDTFSAEVLRNY